MTQTVVGDFLESNVFVVGDKKSCVIVDAGARTEDVAKVVGQRKVCAILLTHGHYDHAFYVLDYAKKFGAKVYASEFAKEYLENADHNCSDGKFVVNDFSQFVFLNDVGELDFDGIHVEYKQLGGHSKSDMMFKIDEEIFVGDVLIGRDMGRIDLYGGDKKKMAESLKTLKEENYTVMHSGHGKDNEKIVQDKVAALWIKFLSR